MLLLSLSTGSLPHLLGRSYYDLNAILSLMQTLYVNAPIDGFEFQKIAEWDSIGPPRDEYREGNQIGRRAHAWRSSSKHTIKEIANLIRNRNLPILSIHANRDVGICLCAGNKHDEKRGRTLINETLSLCEALNSNVVVYHFWDTWIKHIDNELLCTILSNYQSQYPGIRVSVENIPTSVNGYTPFDLASAYKYITLDTRWASMFDELERFHNILPKIVNIHLRATLSDQCWIFESSKWTFDDVINMITKKWKYSGLITLEPEGGYRNSSVDDLIEALFFLRSSLDGSSQKQFNQR